MSKNLFMDGRTMRAIFCNLKKARQQLGLELGIPLDLTDMTMAHFTAPRALVYIYEVLVLAERLLQHYWVENKEA